MSSPPANALFNYDAAGNAMLALTTSGGYSTLAAMKASTSLVSGNLYVNAADGSLWRYASTSVLTSDGDFLVAVVAAGGALLRADREVDIIAAATFATADAAVLYTVPTGFQLQLSVPYNHVTTTWAGGTSSAIGCSSANAGLSTKGDLLGGASGDVTATLVSTGAYAKGTVGAKIGKPAALLVAGDTILFDRITSVYTSGVSVLHFPVKVLLAPAA